MAGANHFWSMGKLKDSLQDGFLTALEMSQMDLHQTQLAVLGACESGLGQLHNNEGMMGMVRALKLAGVRKIMMSLWPVPERETQELFSLFYTNWVNKKMDMHTALERAQKALLNKNYNPFYWAGWVIVE
ncbi:MAG: CHAT domain-containing protein [Dinghuibacter sp.]|nr:CHAT domain-containing protein [Dinghuibacter sp.]